MKSKTVTTLDVFSPAKLNLFLAVTGRRSDGFHDLVSVAAPLKFGDTLVLEKGQGGGCSLACDDPTVPVDDSNLVLRAAKAFAEASGEKLSVRFVLKKRTPMGAGLGGGSSNGVAALLALNRLARRPLSAETLHTLASKLGSDCALFLRGEPVVMRGRGERLETLPEVAAKRLRRRRVLVAKPGFGIATAWAYGRMAASGPGVYLPVDQAEQRLRGWMQSAEPAEKLLYNNMETVAFEKYVALPVLLEKLKSQYGLAAGMSGSGSACFALLRDDSPVEEILRCIRDAWGEHTFIVDTEIG